MGRAGCLLIAVLVPCAAAALAAQPDPDPLATLDSLQNLPTPQAATVRPRVIAAYAALVGAALLGVLYLYRGRAFIVYWIGSWLFVASALALISQSYADQRLGSVLLGLAVLLTVWAAGLVFLAAKSFPDHPLRWNTSLRFAAVTAVWFLAVPFLLRPAAVIVTGTVITVVLLGWSAFRYVRLARQLHYAGAFLIGAGLAILCLSNVAGAAMALQIVSGGRVVNELAIVNVVVSLFVALGMHLLVFEDMTNELRRTNSSLAAANEEVKRLAITDPLTGCHNRRFFDEIERREMQRHRRYKSPLSVLFVDVNHFKKLNDTLGHDRGDEVLRAIGGMLRRYVRESDYVIRWGGDEFLLLLTCGAAEAQGKAAELKVAWEQARIASDLPGRVGLSIGVAAVPPEAETLNDAIRIADSGMYKDKLSERAGA